jgi:protein-tyrosine-phosphatase
MAEVIVKKRLGEAVDVESAGIAPHGNAPSAEAVETVRSFYEVDISGHRPRHIGEADLSRFDYILAMDSSVFMRLQEMSAIPKDKLFAWEIDDPCGRGMEVYRLAARNIESHIERFLLNRDVESRYASPSRSKIKR